MSHIMLMADEDILFEKKVPEGDERERLVCKDCGFINYENPKIIVGSVVTYEGQFLLCKRAIAPRVGYWTIPAGFMELGENPEEGAAREAWEEARAEIVIDRLLAIYSVPHISQVHLMYRSELQSPDISAGPESQEVGLFSWDDIPWDDLAFPSVTWALNHFRKVVDQEEFSPFTNPIL